MRQCPVSRCIANLTMTLALGASVTAWASQPSAPATGESAAASTLTPAPLGKIAPGADLRQIMLGIFFPASNVVFAAQDDPNSFKQDEDAAVSPNPLTSIYGGWQSVENAALALSDASNLLLMPGRLCSNGRPVPLQRPDWANYVQILRDAAAASYRAAHSKNQDAMLQVSDTLTRACDACHVAYRDKYQNSGSSRVCEP